MIEEWLQSVQKIVSELIILVSHMTPQQWGITAGLLQILGYVLYIRKSLRYELEPNPATWLMFAYGTALLTVLEFDLGAEWYLLVLPVVCATLGIYVAYLCWLRDSLSWPENAPDRFAFVADILLTIAFVVAWYLKQQGSITDEERHIATMIFLICSNASTVTAFMPLLRDAYKNPDREHSMSWLVWATAYSALGIATFSEHGWNVLLLLYPISNICLHGLVAIFARKSRHGGVRQIRPRN